MINVNKNKGLLDMHCIKCLSFLLMHVSRMDSHVEKY